MRSFIEPPLGRKLTLDDIQNVVGNRAFDFDGIFEALKYYKNNGEQVYYLVDDYLIKSEDVDKYNDAWYIYENCYSKKVVYPIISIDDFTKEVENLGDWKDPQNQEAYCRIMLQLVGMYNGYNVDLELEDGLKGRFEGAYPSEYINKLISIVKTKFPSSDTVFSTDIFEKSSSDDRKFYAYLAHFNAGGYGGIPFLDNSRFRFEALNSGLVYSDYGMNIDILRKMIEQVKQEKTL